MLYVLLFDHSGTAGVGLMKGGAIGFTIVLLVIIIATICYTIKNGGSGRQVQKNLKNNFLGLLTFDFDATSSSNSKEKKVNR